MLISVPEQWQNVKFAALLYIAFPQVAGHATVVGGVIPVATGVLLICAIFILLVIAPAVWSRRPTRRKAALAVLDALGRFLCRRRHGSP